MPWVRFFESSVEQKLAVRLLLVLVVPLLALAVMTSQQIQRNTEEFTLKHLQTEAKDYGMVLVERLESRVLNQANMMREVPLDDLDDHRLSMSLVDNEMIVSLTGLDDSRELTIALTSIAQDVDDIEHIYRCVSHTLSGCPYPTDALSSSWELRLLSLYDTDVSIYVVTWLPIDEALIQDTALMEVFPYLTALLLVLALYSGALFLRSRLKPLNELKEAVKIVEGGKLGHQISDQGEDEFSELGNAFNSMSTKLGDAFGFQALISEIDQAILSGSDLKAVFAKCGETLETYCGTNQSLFVESREDIWLCYRYETDRFVDQFTKEVEPRIEDYFEKGQAFPILHDQAIAGWLFVNTLKKENEPQVLEVIRKISVAIVNLRSSQELYKQANYDDLTGLLNRTSFGFSLARKMARIRRTGDSGILVFLDLDEFKKVNDSQGHSAGDQLLQIVATRLSDIVREEDIVARFGGDEFALALDAFTDEQDLIKFLSRLIGELNVPVRVGQLEVPVKASIGVCVFPKDGDTVEGLLKNADIAMYRAKNARGSSFVFYNESLNEEAERQMLIESKLSAAIRENKIQLFLQPKLDLRTGRINSSEALSRWIDEDLGFIPPDEFIAVAERSGLIEALTNNIFYNVANLLEAYPTAVQKIAINISPQELDRPKFAEQIIALLNQHKVDHQMIELEVTESNFMDDPEKVAEILQTFRNTGIQISLDDFGTGYSSLNLLRQLPLDLLKIDKSFIDEITEHVSARNLVEKIIEIAKNLDMGVVAEGVETEEQLALLDSMSCTYAQGYLISKPLPAEEAISFINDWNERHPTKKIAQLF